jgi:hypothetical protein
MAAFQAWAEGVGDAMIDPGAPLGAAKTVSTQAATDGSASGAASGYTLIEAANIDAAVELVQGHPFVARGGTSK